MNKLNIDWLYDEHDCETCGGSYSIGAVVKYNNKIILDKPACAHCFSEPDIDYEQILYVLCKHLKTEVKENKYKWLNNE